MTPCSEGFPLSRFPPTNGTPQFPIYIPPPPPAPPPLHESYAYNRTYPPQGLPTFPRPDITHLKSYVDNLFVSQERRIEVCEQRITRLESENFQLKVQLERRSGKEVSSSPANTTTESSNAPINVTERSNAPINLTVRSNAPKSPTTKGSSVPVNPTRGSSVLVNPRVESSAPTNPIVEEPSPTGFDPLNDETLTQPSGGVHESPIVDSIEDSEADCIHTRPQIYEEVPIVPLPLDPIKPPKGQLYLMGGLDHNGKMNRTVKFVKRVRFVRFLRLRSWMRVLCSGQEFLKFQWIFIVCILQLLFWNQDKFSFLLLSQQFIKISKYHLYQVLVMTNTPKNWKLGELDHWCVVSSERRQPSCLGSFAPLNGKICSVGGYHCTTP